MATRFKNDLGGLEALLEAAKFVELQDKLKNGLVYSISSKIEEAPLSPLSSQKRPSSPIAATNGSSRTKASQSPPVGVVTGGAATWQPVSSSSNGFAAHKQYVSGASVPLLSSLALVSSTVPAPTVSVAALPSSGPAASLLYNFQNGRSSHTLHHQYRQHQQQPIRIPPRTQHHISSAFSPTRISPLNGASAISCSPSSSPSQSSTPPPHFAQRNVSSVGHALMSRHHDHMGYIDQNSDQYRRPSPTYIGSVPPSSSLNTTSAAEVRRRLGASGTREVHNKLEKNRRAHLKECFELLKCQVPSTQDEKKTSNLTVLRSAIRYIQILKRRERENEQEVERLAREKTMNQQRLCSLKKELQAQWDHIDFNALIPDPIEIAPVQRRSEFLTGQNYCNPHLNGVTGSNGTNDERRSSENEKNGNGIMMLVSDTDESSSQPRSRADTLYSSTSSSMSSFSPPNTQSSMCSSSENFTSQHSQLIDASSAGSPVQFATNSPVQFATNNALSSVQYNEDEPIALVSDHKSGQYPNTIFTRASPPSDKIAAIAITEPSQRTSPSNGTLPAATCQNVISSAIKLTMPNRFAVSAGNDMRPIKFTTVPRTVSSTKVISTSDFKAANQMPILNGHHQYFIKSAISATPTSFESSLR